MKIQLKEDSTVNITFHDSAKVSLRGSHAYDVKWFYNNEFYGNMFINGGTWGAFPIPGVGNWKIEFWENGNLYYTFDNNLTNKDILVIFENSGHDFGDFVKQVKEQSNRIINDYFCNLYVFFKNSELCDFSDTKINPLRLNDKIKTFNVIHTWTI
jgi:hypothetical protein